MKRTPLNWNEKKQSMNRKKGNSIKTLPIGIGLVVLLVCSTLIPLLLTTLPALGAPPADTPLSTASTPPVIYNIQQDPPRDAVGYEQVVNISCQVSSPGPLFRVQLNLTSAYWDMYNNSGTYWFTFTPYILGYTYRYCIVAENAWGVTITEEFNFTTKDLTPPNIIHTNSSEWVTPCSPFRSDLYLRIECQVFDAKASVSWVNFNLSLGAGLTNMTINMIWNASASRYYRIVNIGSYDTVMYYTIFAMDSNNNVNITRQFSITIDDAPPVVVSTPVPATVQYNTSAYIQANISDLNLVTAVHFKWSLDWVINHTVEISHVGGQTWQTITLIPAQLWNTTVHWEINATDNGGNWGITYGSYQVGDAYAPLVTNLEFELNPSPNTPYSINITIQEPAGASGLKLQRIYYGLSSESYQYKPLNLVHLEGDRWGAHLPGQTGETVRWYLYVEDNAGNNYTSCVHEYSVGGGGGIPFGSLLFIFLGILFGTIAAYFLTKGKLLHSRSKGVSR